MNEKICLITQHVRTVLREPGSHGLDHTLRVTKLCKKIGGTEKACMDILIPAALLHDIARPLEKLSGIPHEEEGAKIAQEYLTSISYDKIYIEPIMHAIRAHRFTSHVVPETLEAKILSDADKLDAIGAIGIARTFISAGERQGDMFDALDHIDAKLIKLKDLMFTDTGKQIAEVRHQFLESFVRRISDELNGLP